MSVLTAAFAVAVIAANARGQTVVVASFSVKGGSPLCGMTTAKPDTLDSFEETTIAATTSQAATTATGKTITTYELELSTLCVAPFFKAVGTNQVLSVEIKYLDKQSHNTVLTLSMPNVSLESVTLSASADSGDAAPTLAMKMWADDVTMGGASSTQAKSAMMPGSAAKDRPRAPTILRDLSIHRRMIEQRAAAAWTGTVAGTNVQLGGASSTVNTSLAVNNFRLTCSSPHDPTSGYLTGARVATLDDWQKPVDAATATIHSLVGHQAVPASAKIVDASGTAGVTISFPKLFIRHDNLSNNTESIGTNIDGFQLTDIISGKGVTGGC